MAGFLLHLGPRGSCAFGSSKRAITMESGRHALHPAGTHGEFLFVFNIRKCPIHFRQPVVPANAS